MSRYTQANRAKWRSQCRESASLAAYGDDWGVAGRKPQPKKSPEGGARRTGKRPSTNEGEKRREP